MKKLSAILLISITAVAALPPNIINTSASIQDGVEEADRERVARQKRNLKYTKSYFRILVIKNK